MIADADLSANGSPEAVLRQFDADIHAWAEKIVDDFDTCGEKRIGYEEFQNLISQHPTYTTENSIK